MSFGVFELGRDQGMGPIGLGLELSDIQRFLLDSL